MDYNSLVTTAASRLNRSDLNSLIPDFITRAEDEIFARLARQPVRPMVETATTNLVSGDQDTSLPSDFIDAVDATLTDADDNVWRLVRIAPADQADWYATRALPYRTDYNSDRVHHYTIKGTTIELAEELEASHTLTLVYFAKPDRLTASTLTNWVIDNHADVYEFGTLAHAYRHLHDDEREDRYISKFLGAIDFMLAAYPEKGNPAERRADLPVVTSRWSITNG